MEDTIVAIATPPGQGAVSLIRISGNESVLVANKVFKCNKLDWLSAPRTQCFEEFITVKLKRLIVSLQLFSRGLIVILVMM